VFNRTDWRQIFVSWELSDVSLRDCCLKDIVLRAENKRRCSL